MLNLELTPAETRVLKETLETDLADLSMEISHTDRLEYRDRLKEKRNALLKAVEQIIQFELSG